MKPLIKIIVIFILLSINLRSIAQEQYQYSPVTTGASFLLISPDARATGVAEAATGLTADANAAFINAAKLSFAGKTEISVSYVPWLRQLGKDLHLGYLSAHHQFGDRETIGLSLKYLDLGSINFRDEAGMLLQQYQASEYAVTGIYSRKFGEGLAMALSGKYIHSDLGSGTFNGMEMKSVNAFAADVSVYSEQTLSNSRYAWGVSLSNIGTKLNYTSETSRAAFLPMNLRIGGGYTLFRNGTSSITLLADINKLMVPTTPIYKRDENGMPTDVIEKGKDPNRSVSSALFTSLFDAPGGFKEELAEFTVAGGFELSYQDQLFLRSGFFYENPEKGNRQHFAVGAGLKVRPFQFDISYIAPTSQRYVLKNGLKFTISYALDK
jgi:hypothetical protein